MRLPKYNKEAVGMGPVKMCKVINGIRYDTEKAVIIAHDCYWDGHNMERYGRRRYKMELTMTKKGFPALWEEGGGWSNTGSATIVAGPNGERLKPVYVRRAGHLAGGDHALLIVRKGYHVVKASHHRRDFTIKVYRIVDIDLEDKVAQVECLCEFSMGEWDNDPPPMLEEAIEAARAKATCYHCRSPHYAIT